MATAGDVWHGLLDAAVTETVRRFGASVGGVYILPADEPVLSLAVACGMPAEFLVPWARIPLAAPLPAADAVRGQRLVWVESQAELTRAYPRAALAVPYQFALANAPITSTRRWGALVLLWPGARTWIPSGEREAIVGVCRRLARLLEGAARTGRPLTPPDQPRVLAPEPLRPHTRRHAPTATSFIERLPGGCCALDLEGRITFVSTRAAELLGRSAGLLLGTLPWEALPWLDDPGFEDRYWAAVISRRPAFFTACRPPGRWLHFDLYPDASGISVRITQADAVPGPVRRPPRAAALARPGQLYQLMHLAATLTEAVGVSDVVDLVTDQIMPAFGVQGMALFTAEAGRLRIEGSCGSARDAVDRFDGAPLDTTFTPAVRALRSGIPSFFTSSQDMELLYPDAPRVPGKQAWAFLPLIASGHPVGCCVLCYARPHPFAADERAVLTSLAGLIAQALDRAQMYDTKHRLAHGLQQALLPRTLPSLPGLRVAARYLPATRGMDVGGDFYDLIRLDATHAAAVIGDVQGHNVSAAALMGQVRTAVHATADAHPGHVLARTNRLLCELDTGLFASCVYAHLDLAHHRAHLASAGHPPPLLRHADRRTRTLDVPPGLLLGVDPDADYPVTAIALPPGAILALYTDGLVETPGTDIDQATTDLARRLARTDDRDLRHLADTLLHSTRPAAGQRTDDIALLLLQPTAPPASPGPGP